MYELLRDAVMAGFARTADAVVAAREMIDTFDRFNAEGRAKSEDPCRPTVSPSLR